MESKTERRAKEIVRILLRRGTTSVEDLTSAFATSSASIRRDLVRLEERGLVHRTHGGVMLAQQQTYEPFRFDASFHVREGRFAKEKQRIALAAAELVHENESIGLTAGTTTTQLAQQLRLRSGLRILTNAVNIAMDLSANDKIETTLTGGCMRWPGAFSLVGPAALETLNNVVMDKVFVGVCGVSLEHGATTIEADEAAVVRAMTRRAKQVIVVADASKVGMSSPAVVCETQRIHTLVTDDGVSEAAVMTLRQAGIHVLVN